MKEVKRLNYREIREEIEQECRERYNGRDYTMVFTNGCFSLLHPGHIDTLSYAYRLAGQEGIVIVGINSDESITRIKGPGKNILNEEARTSMLLSLRQVDYVVVFDEDTPEELITELKPDILVKADEYKKEDIEKKYGKISLVLLSQYNPEWSTTKLIEKIKAL